MKKIEPFVGKHPSKVDYSKLFHRKRIERLLAAIEYSFDIPTSMEREGVHLEEYKYWLEHVEEFRDGLARIKARWAERVEVVAFRKALEGEKDMIKIILEAYKANTFTPQKELGSVNNNLYAYFGADAPVEKLERMRDKLLEMKR